MADAIAQASGIEAATSAGLRLIGAAIDIFGVLVIVAGITWATALFLRQGLAESQYDAFKHRIGRSLLLGLEVLVAADIVKTVAIELTATSLVVLAGLVLVRTFLSWTLVLEVEGRWPWQRPALPPPHLPASMRRAVEL